MRRGKDTDFEDDEEEDGVTESGEGMVLNLAELDETKLFELVDKGDYPVECVTAEFGDSQAGNPMVTLTLEILDGEEVDMEVDEKFVGRKLKQWIVLSNDIGKKQLKRALLKFDCDVDMANVNLEEVDEIFEGRKAIASVGYGKMGKEKVNNISGFKPYGESGSFINRN